VGPTVTEFTDPVVGPTVTEVTDHTDPITGPTMTEFNDPVAGPTVTDFTDPIAGPTMTEFTDPVAGPTVTDFTDPIAGPTMTEFTDPVAGPTVTDFTDPIAGPTMAEFTDPVAGPTVTDFTDPVAGPTDQSAAATVLSSTDITVINLTKADQDVPLDIAVINMLKEWGKDPKGNFVFGTSDNDGHLNLIIADRLCHLSAAFLECVTKQSDSSFHPPAAVGQTDLYGMLFCRLSCNVLCINC